MGKQILITIPDYAHALILINKLALEIIRVELLPGANVDENNMPKAYSLESFSDKVYKLTVQGEDLMKRFFIFIKYIINEVREAYYEKLLFYHTVLEQEDIM
jgi:hypothetical protein